MREFYAHSIYFDKIDDQREKAAAVKTFIGTILEPTVLTVVDLLLQNLYGKPNVKHFISTLVHSKYFPIKETFEKIPSN